MKSAWAITGLAALACAALGAGYYFGRDQGGAEGYMTPPPRARATVAPTSRAPISPGPAV